LPIGDVYLAKRNATVKDPPSVGTLGFTSTINSDKTGTLTMNQMTAVEMAGPHDRYPISGIGEGKVQHAAGRPAATGDVTLLPSCGASNA
jgi:Ca2+-transporting ATPase